MKVFISWSGARSRAVADLLHTWIKCVLQNAKPWMSSRDLDRGSIWFTEICGNLGETNIGIICLTGDNKTKPWILFEAGALAKGLSGSRVCTFLIDIAASDVRDPLAQFNHTLPDRDGVFSLINTINAALKDQGLDGPVLNQVFDTYWPQFSSAFDRIIQTIPAEEVATPRGPEDLLSEVLSNTRSMLGRLNALESRQSLLEINAETSSIPKGYPLSASYIRQLVDSYMRKGFTYDGMITSLIRNGNPQALIDAVTRQYSEMIEDDISSALASK